MTAQLAPVPVAKFFSNDGFPLSFGQLFTYAAGTTTPLVTYVDSTQTTQNTNPIQLNFRGECNLWLDPTKSYKFLLQDLFGNTIPGWPVDNIAIGNANPSFNVIPTVDNLYTLGNSSFAWANVYVGVNHAPILDTVSGNIGYYARTSVEISAGVTPLNYSYVPGHAFRYMTSSQVSDVLAGTLILDVSVALNNSIAAVGSGGRVIWQNGAYLATSPILAENFRGLTIVADGGQFGFNGTRIVGKHSGKAILSMVGSIGFNIGALILEGNAATSPKTGLLLGRSSSASAGSHKFTGLTVQGNYTVAAVYNIASEENDWFGCQINPTAAPFTGLYMSGSDGVIATIGGLTASSMESNRFYGGLIGNQDATSGSAAIWIDGSIATGHHYFYGTFLSKQGGDSFIFIRLGQVDGQGIIFPICFHSVVAEFGGSSAPNSGLHIRNATSTDPLPFVGLTAYNVRFQTPVSWNIICDGVGHIQFQGANIVTPNTTGTRQPSQLGNLDNGSYANLQFENTVTVNEATDSTIICGQGGLTLTTNTGGNVIKNGASKYQLPVLTSAPIVGVAAATVSSGQISYGGTTSNTATAGANGAPPAQVTTYIICNVNGTTVKIPCYNN